MPSVKALLMGLFSSLVLVTPAWVPYRAPPADSQRRVVWHLPLDGPLGSPFGHRWGRMHEGIDIEGWAETRVHAARSGIVTAVGWLPHYEGYGFVLKIRHEGGFVTMYAHLAKAFVRRGDRVYGGELIARAGCTGSCTGVHLHFQMWNHGKLVDPLRYLGRHAFER